MKADTTYQGKLLQNGWFPGDRMAKAEPLESRWQAILDLKLVPAVVRLPPAVRAERRDMTARQALLRRVHSEFAEMPGLSLTLDQATKLFGLRPDIVSRILVQLTDACVLRQRSDGQFALITEEL
jgi:hypothetical protein